MGSSDPDREIEVAVRASLKLVLIAGIAVTVLITWILRAPSRLESPLRRPFILIAAAIALVPLTLAYVSLRHRLIVGPFGVRVTGVLRCTQVPLEKIAGLEMIGEHYAARQRTRFRFPYLALCDTAGHALMELDTRQYPADELRKALLHLLQIKPSISVDSDVKSLLGPCAEPAAPDHDVPQDGSAG